MTATPAPNARYVASAGCSGCPHRTICSEARQRVHDQVIEVGRHYTCDFYLGITAALGSHGRGRCPVIRRLLRAAVRRLHVLLVRGAPADQLTQAERFAALLDGRVSAEERERLLVLLGRDAAAFEIFADAAAALYEAGQRGEL